MRMPRPDALLESLNDKPVDDCSNPMSWRARRSIAQEKATRASKRLEAVGLIHH